MCYNKTVSIISYVVGLSNCYILFRRGYKIEALFYAYVIQMQLVEFLLWSNNKCNGMNKNITKIGIGLNHLQPIVLYYIVLYYTKNIPDYIHYLVVMYIVLNVMYFMHNYKLLHKCTIGIVNKKELEWSIQYGKMTRFYFIFVFMLAILCIVGMQKHNYLNAFLLVFTFAISYVKYRDSKGVGTIWCIIAAYIPLLLNIIYTIEENKKKEYVKVIE